MLLMSRGRGSGMSNCSRMRPGIAREQDHAIGEADGFAHVMRDEDDRLAPLLPDPLDVAVKLLARQRVERGEWFVHQQDARIRRERPGQGDALFHPAGKLMDMRGRELLQADQLQKKLRDLEPFLVRQARFEFQSEHDVARSRRARERARIPET